MTKHSLNILLVDDAPNIEEIVSEGLQRIGIISRIDAHFPKRRSEPFGGCALPKGKDLDAFDLALIDLELFPIVDFLVLGPDDLRGGTEILPYLRAEAPWLPVIAYSQHFEQIVVQFLPIACSFGFDGYLPRGIFTNKALTQPLWDTICERAYALRMKAALGENFELHLPEIDLSLYAGLTEELAGRLPQWKLVVKYLFHFADSVALSPLTGGWSGATVVRAFVKQASRMGAREGEWLIKLSSDITKLNREARAHTRMVRNGLEYARNVQLLWSSVIKVDQTGGIAYQFARGTKEAATLLAEGMSLRDVSGRISTVVQRLYMPRSTKRDIIINLLRKWSPAADALNKAAEEIGSGDVADLLRAVGENRAKGELIETIEFQESLIHGDFHLGNVMLGERDVLIDFACSDVGPVAVDLARLVTDLLIRVPRLRPSKFQADWTNRGNEVGEAFSILITGMSIDSSDRRLVNYFLQIFLAEHLNYANVPLETREWIISIFKKSDVVPGAA